MLESRQGPVAEGANVSLRPAAAGDSEFLYRLYASTREDVAAVPWPAAERERFLRSQWTAQQADYETRFPDSVHSVVVLGGIDVGRIWIDRRPDEIRMLDVAILPEHRNSGVGAQLVGRLIAESQLADLPLRHSVYKANLDALRFYERMGFATVEDFELYVLMEWQREQPTRPTPTG